MIYYAGDQKTESYFEGWYFKCKTGDGKCLALIPAVHIDETGHRNVSIQVITDNQSWWLQNPAHSFSALTELFRIQIGENVFSEQGLQLSIHDTGIDLEGRVLFGPFHRLTYPIMGPFQLIPRLECYHSVISMKHTLMGELVLNGERYDFREGVGYIESDRGSSFPSAYLWVQDIWDAGSVMLSVARIPLGKLSFTGCICSILLNGKSYRFATYLGARVMYWSSRSAQVCQGRYRLEVEAVKKRDLPLKAPSDGKMVRTVHESLDSVVRIRLTRGKKILLERMADGAGFEYADI